MFQVTIVKANFACEPAGQGFELPTSRLKVWCASTAPKNSIMIIYFSIWCHNISEFCVNKR